MTQPESSEKYSRVSTRIRLRRDYTGLASATLFLVLGLALYWLWIKAAQRLGIPDFFPLGGFALPPDASPLVPIGRIVGYVGFLVGLLPLGYAFVSELTDLLVVGSRRPARPEYTLGHEFSDLTFTVSLLGSEEQRRAAAFQLLHFARLFYDAGTPENARVLLGAITSIFPQSDDPMLQNIAREASAFATMIEQGEHEPSAADWMERTR
jgi:hypothetical protein